MQEKEILNMNRQQHEAYIVYERACYASQATYVAAEKVIQAARAAGFRAASDAFDLAKSKEKGDITRIDACDNAVTRANVLDAKAKEVEESVRAFEDSRNVSLEVFQIELRARTSFSVVEEKNT